MSSGNNLGALMRSVNGPPGIGLVGSGRRRRRRGGDFLGIGNFFRKGWERFKRKPISTIGGLAGFIPGPIGTIGRIAGTAGGLAGLGRRRGGTAIAPFPPLPSLGSVRFPRRQVVPYFGKGRRRRRAGGSLGSMLKKAHEFVKQKRLISSALRHFAPKSNLHKAAHALGYGRRRRRRGRGPLLNMTRDGIKKLRALAVKMGYGRRGGSFGDVFKKAHKFVKDKRLVSSALKHFGQAKLSKAAHAMGYGRRRRRVVRRRRAGGSLSSILKKAHEFVKQKRLVSSALRHFAPKSNLHKAAHAMGYGRRR